MSKVYLALLISISFQTPNFAQNAPDSVIEQPTTKAFADSSLVQASFQETAPTAAPTRVLSSPAEPLFSVQSPTPAKSPTTSLVGDQLNRITPKPVDHSPFITAGCNCNRAVPANSASYTAPAMRLPSIGSVGSPGYTTPIINHNAAQFSPPVTYNNLPAYRPFYGTNQCYNPARINRIQRGLGWRWRR